MNENSLNILITKIWSELEWKVKVNISNILINVFYLSGDTVWQKKKAKWSKSFEQQPSSSDMIRIKSEKWNQIWSELKWKVKVNILNILINNVSYLSELHRNSKRNDWGWLSSWLSSVRIRCDQQSKKGISCKDEKDAFLYGKMIKVSWAAAIITRYNQWKWTSMMHLEHLDNLNVSYLSEVLRNSKKNDWSWLSSDHHQWG